MELIPVSGLSSFSLLRGLLGISVLILIAFLLSNNRKAISWKTVSVGLFVQFIVAFGVLKVKLIKKLINRLPASPTKDFKPDLIGKKLKIKHIAKRYIKIKIIDK